jgi:glucose-1-phosphatase
MNSLSPEFAGTPPAFCTIFIDFGNVIGFFDHHKATALLAPFTDMPEPELFRTLYGGRLEEDYEHGRIATEQYVREATKAARLTCTPDDFVHAFQAIFTPNPEIIELIARLKPKYRLVLASNTTDAHYRRYCVQFAPTISLFDMRCPSHEIGHRKPAAEYYEHCNRFAAAPPHQCLFIDDIEENIRAARNTVRWKGIVYKPRSGFMEKLKDLGIELS